MDKATSTRSTEPDDDPQASIHYQMAYPTFAGLQDGSAFDHGCQEEMKHRCMHPTHLDDERPTFTAKKELTRHMKVHDPDAILWNCGCCQNIGNTFEPKTRKDKVYTHLRKIHEKPRSEDNKGIRCPMDGCYTLFTAPSCLDEHWSQKHQGHPRELQRQTINGE